MAAAADNWRDELTFSERLSAISSLVSAYRRLDSSAEFALAQSKAQKQETKILERATSKDEYRLLLEQKIDRLSGRRSKDVCKQALEEDFADYDLQSGTRMGSYDKAVLVKETLHSKIYKVKQRLGDEVRYLALKAMVDKKENRPHDLRRETFILSRVFKPQKLWTDCHILKLENSFHESSSTYVTVYPYMPYNFDDLLHQGITARQVQSHLRDLFTALAHIHSLGIIHRDVKPSNLLLASADGPAYLADFATAWDPENTTELKEAAGEKITDVGTTCYRPPELLFGYKSYDVSLDLWAAGCVVAEAVDSSRKSLFDAGPLGSELTLLHSMFTTLGTPNEDTWPSAKHLPDWGKIEFKEYPAKSWEEILGDAPSDGRDLASQLVRFEASQRLWAEKVLNHPYFGESRNVDRKQQLANKEGERETDES